jgi:hypothetical protein
MPPRALSVLALRTPIGIDDGRSGGGRGIRRRDVPDVPWADEFERPDD